MRTVRDSFSCTHHAKCVQHGTPLVCFAGIESDTWLTGHPRSQDPAPHKSVQIRLSLTALLFKPEMYGTTTLVVTHENSANTSPRSPPLVCFARPTRAPRSTSSILLLPRDVPSHILAVMRALHVEQTSWEEWPQQYPEHEYEPQYEYQPMKTDREPMPLSS